MQIVRGANNLQDVLKRCFSDHGMDFSNFLEIKITPESNIIIIKSNMIDDREIIHTFLRLFKMFVSSEIFEFEFPTSNQNDANEASQGEIFLVQELDLIYNKSQNRLQKSGSKYTLNLVGFQFQPIVSAEYQDITISHYKIFFGGVVFGFLKLFVLGVFLETTIANRFFNPALHL
ncbi:hypothetical protein G9A89_000942 [Geosiphon pyriformis]|nr:hypothetical protein G9A89_000942 [Geosiphon pyriformis]